MQLPISLPVPTPRSQETAVYDPASNRVTIYGGLSLPDFAIFNDTWVLTNANGLSGALSISQTLPDHGGDGGTVTVRLVGSGFQAGATVTMSTPGGELIGPRLNGVDMAT